MTMPTFPPEPNEESQVPTHAHSETRMKNLSLDNELHLLELSTYGEIPEQTVVRT